jgi:hypothetical protein
VNKFDKIFSLHIRGAHVHFLNYLSIYWCDYLNTQTIEYWEGHRRKRIFKFGKLTIWIWK